MPNVVAYTDRQVMLKDFNRELEIHIGTEATYKLDQIDNVIDFNQSFQMYLITCQEDNYIEMSQHDFKTQMVNGLIYSVTNKQWRIVSRKMGCYIDELYDEIHARDTHALYTFPMWVPNKRWLPQWYVDLLLTK